MQSLLESVGPDLLRRRDRGLGGGHGQDALQAHLRRARAAGRCRGWRSVPPSWRPTAAAVERDLARVRGRTSPTRASSSSRRGSGSSIGISIVHRPDDAAGARPPSTGARAMTTSCSPSRTSPPARAGDERGGQPRLDAVGVRARSRYLPAASSTTTSPSTTPPTVGLGLTPAGSEADFPSRDEPLFVTDERRLGFIVCTVAPLRGGGREGLARGRWRWATVTAPL